MESTPDNYYTGPTYGIRDRQCDPVVAYCFRCGGEMYQWHDSGLCDFCRREQEELEARE